MYELTHGLSWTFFSDIFKYKNSHPFSLRHNSQFSRPYIKTVTESMSYLSPIIWDILPVTCNKLLSLGASKNKIKKMKTWYTLQVLAGFVRQKILNYLSTQQLKFESVLLKMLNTPYMFFSNFLGNTFWKNILHFTQFCYGKSELIFKNLAFYFLNLFKVLLKLL